MRIKFDKILEEERELDQGLDLAVIQDPNFKGEFATDTDLIAAIPVGQVGRYAYVWDDTTGGTDYSYWFRDPATSTWVNSNSTQPPITELFDACISIDGYIAPGGNNDDITNELLIMCGTAGRNGMAVPFQTSGLTTEGILVSGEKVELYDNLTKKKIVNPATNEEVYGRLTELVGVYTISYYTLENGTQSPYPMPVGTVIDMEVNYRFDFYKLPVNAMTGIKAKRIYDDTIRGDKHWRTPVNGVIDLPTSGNDLGDVRFVTTLGIYYRWNGSVWLSEGSTVGTGALTNFLGYWNANTNTPLIISGVGNLGDFYIVNVAGNTNIDGISTRDIGDYIWRDDSDGVRRKISNTTVSGGTFIIEDLFPDILVPNAPGVLFNVTNSDGISNINQTNIRINGVLVLRSEIKSYTNTDPTVFTLTVPYWVFPTDTITIQYFY